MNFAFPRFALLLLTIPLTGVCAQPAQKPLSQMSVGARQLVAIKVVGSKHFPEADIAAESGLQIGQPVTDEDFKKAARILGDTGAFTDIQYIFSYSSAGTKLEFRVVDVDKFVPAHFLDFVWFSEAEMQQRIKEHVPMFEGELPLFGRMADEISDVLQAMLVENGIPGHVDYVRAGKNDGPVDAINYKVSDVLIRIRNIKFTGAGESELPALEEAGRRLADREYSKARLNLLVQRQLLPVYYARGYLRASFGDPQPQVVKEAGEESDEGPRNQSIVDITFPVTPGQQYTLSRISWTGNHEFPTDTLQKMVPAELGKPANTIRIGDELKGVQTLYASRGFVKASIAPEPQFDDTNHTVAIVLAVKEDSAYHMGDLEFRGLDNSLTAKLRNIWKIRPGEIYDATYLNEYLPEAQKLLPANLDWQVSPHVTANIREKTVDVDLIYSVKAPK